MMNSHLKGDPGMAVAAACQKQLDEEGERDEFMQRKAREEVEAVKDGYGPQVLDEDTLVEVAMEEHATELQRALGHFAATNDPRVLREVLASAAATITERSDWDERVDAKGPM